jgi:hypothetical protein
VLLVMCLEACKQLSLHLHLAWSLFRISVHVNIPFFFRFDFLLHASSSEGCLYVTSVRYQEWQKSSFEMAVVKQAGEAQVSHVQHSNHNC